MLLNKLNEFFKACADAIRAKRGTTNEIRPDRMANEIMSITSRPPTTSGEYYHIIENDGTDDALITGVTYYGQLYNFRSLNNDAKIKEVVFYDDIKDIVDGFLYSTKAIERVKFDGDITSLGNSLFSNSSLREFVGPDGIVNAIPKTVTSIPEYCFNNCANLSGVDMHDNITSIGQYAFYRSGIGNSFKDGALPKNLQTIGASAFYNQQIPLTEIPEKVTSIGSNAFYQNVALTTLTFKGTPSSINSSAFNACTTLKTINVPWAEGAVTGAPWGATNATINYNHT